jgi:hypothetical protein
MHGVIDRRVRAFLQGLARSQTGVQGGSLKLAKVPVLQGIMGLLIIHARKALFR